MRNNLIFGGLMLASLGLVSCNSTPATPAVKNPYAASIAAGGLPAVGETKTGILNLKLSSCNITTGCNFSEDKSVTKGQILQYCAVVYNGTDKAIKNITISTMSDPASKGFEPMNIYGEDASKGTWISYNGSSTYTPYQAKVSVPNLEVGETVFVCQAFKLL